MKNAHITCWCKTATCHEATAPQSLPSWVDLSAGQTDRINDKACGLHALIGLSALSPAKYKRHAVKHCYNDTYTANNRIVLFFVLF
jgi:hypothetical protein